MRIFLLLLAVNAAALMSFFAGLLSLSKISGETIINFAFALIYYAIGKFIKHIYLASKIKNIDFKSIV